MTYRIIDHPVIYILRYIDTASLHTTQYMTSPMSEYMSKNVQIYIPTYLNQEKKISL